MRINEFFSDACDDKNVAGPKKRRILFRNLST